MKKKNFFAGIVLCALSSIPAHANLTCTSPDALQLAQLPGSCDPEWQADPAKCPNCFRPNFDYPTELPLLEELPWADTDFTSEPEKFLEQVFVYVLEGFEGHNRSQWNVHKNNVRPWFHAPWMHPHDVDGSGLSITTDPKDAGVYGPVRTGREYLLGLTEELQSFSHFLGAGQSEERTNWAVSFYNERAAHTLWKVWGSGSESPRLHEHAIFAPGSVFAKPLYTTATAAEVPLLRGAPTAIANVSQNRFEPWNRKPAVVHLLQFDVAVKIAPERFTKLTGLENTFTWVYGTFVYDGRAAGPRADPWSLFRPVGLAWGNDSTVADCSDGELKESKVLLESSDLGIDTPARSSAKPCLKETFGRGGRMNGPVDGINSSCTSCHGAAQFRKDRDPDDPASAQELFRAPWPAPWSSDLTNEAFWDRDRCLFENRSPLKPLGDFVSSRSTECYIEADKYITTDTSLQLAFGMNRYCKFITAQNAMALKWGNTSLLERAIACRPSYSRVQTVPHQGDGAVLEIWSDAPQSFQSNLPAKGGLQ